MAQANETPRVYFVATLGQTMLDYSSSFTASAESLVGVVKNGTELDNPDDFSVDVGTGVVTLVDAAETGDEYGVYRKTPISRITSFINTGLVDLEALDDDVDQLYRIAQEMNEIADRCLKYDESINLADVDTSMPSPAAGGIIQYDDDLTLVAVVPD